MPLVTSIEQLPAELWFTILDFFSLVDIHRLIYNLNSRINRIIHGTQGLHISVLKQEDTQYVRNYGNKISLSFRRTMYYKN